MVRSTSDIANIVPSDWNAHAQLELAKNSKKRLVVVELLNEELKLTSGLLERNAFCALGHGVIMNKLVRAARAEDKTADSTPQEVSNSRRAAV